MEVATAALAVSNMAAHPPARPALVTDGVVAALVVALRDAHTSTTTVGSFAPADGAPEVESCVRALWALAPEPAAAAAVASAGGIALLLTVLGEAGDVRERRSVARACNGALRVLTGSEANRQVTACPKTPFSPSVP